jgi:hypothetical protein
VRATDFPSRVIRSGSTVERPRDRTVRSGVKAAIAGNPPNTRESGTGSPEDPEGAGVVHRTPVESARAAQGGD